MISQRKARAERNLQRLLIGLVAASHAFIVAPKSVYEARVKPSIVPRHFSSKKSESIWSPTIDSTNEVDKESSILLPSAQSYLDFSDDKMLFTMMALMFVVGSLSSLDRVAMSVALVPMTEEMHYTDSIKGSISSLFSVGYGIGILPSGLLIASLSPRWVMTWGILLWSVGTMVTPIAASQANMIFLLGARALVGVSESVAIPTVQRLLSNWVSPANKSLAVATVFAGFQSGTILAYSLSPFLITQFDNWRVLFYIYGGAGILYLVPWMLYARDTPAPVPTDFDANELEATTKTTTRGTVPNALLILTSAPWQGFASSKGVWAMFLAHAANNWGLYNNLSWTPTFYSEQYGLNVNESAFLLVVPSIAGAVCGLSGGSIADHVIRRLQDPTDESVTRVRKIFQGIALLGPSVCLGSLAFAIPEDPKIAQTLFSVSAGLQAFNAAGYGAANQEKAGEKWTGLLYGITSLPSVMIGTFAVYLTGRILDATSQNWALVFGLNSIVFFLGGVAFIVLYDSRKEFD